MYIGHLFAPLHCKFATFMANDSARSAIFVGWPSVDCGKCRHADCMVARLGLISGAAGWMQEGRAWCGLRRRTGKCTAVRCPMQRAALAGAAHCVGQCSALRAGGLPRAGWETPRLCDGGMGLGRVSRSCGKGARKGLLGHSCHSVLLVAGRLWNPLTAPCARTEKQRRGQPVCCLRLGM